MATASYELFDPYPVTGEEIREAAQQSSSSAEALESLEGEVDREHRPAVDSAQGDIEPHIQSAPMPAQQQSQAVREKVNFAKGTLNLFAIAVDDYNLNSTDPRSISKLNQAYREQMNNSFGLNYDDYEDGGPKEDSDYSTDWQTASQSLISTLKTEKGRLETNLDDEAETVSGMLQRGPNAEDIKALFRAGALPINADTMFPDVTFTKADWEAYLIERAQNGDLPDMRFIPDEYRDDLLNDEDVMAAVRDGIQVDGDWGTIDGNVLVDGERGPDFWRVQNNLAWLGAYAAFAQKYNQDHPNSTEFDLTTDMRDYLANFYDTAGSPSQVKERIDALGLSDYADQDEIFRRNFANGLLALSDERLGGGFDQLPDDFQAAFKGDGEGLLDFAPILSKSTIAGGEDFSKHLTITVMQTVDLADSLGQSQEMQGGDDPTEGQEYKDLENLLTSMFDVTSRNHEAMHDLITGEDMDGFEGLEQDLGSDEYGDYKDDYDPRDFLAQVYTNEWADNGANAAELTEWMGDVHTDENASEHEKQLADDAFKSWFDIVTTTGTESPSTEGHRETLFYYLMENADSSPGADDISFGEMNPELANSLARTTTDYLDWLASPSTDPADGQSAEDDLATLDSAERVRLMMLAATTDESATTLGVGITAYQQGNGLTVGTDGASDVGSENGRLQAFYDAALHNEAMMRTDNAQEAANEAAARKQAVIDFFVSAAGGTPVGNNPLANIAKGAFQAGAGEALKVQPEDIALMLPRAETTNSDPSEFKYQSTYDLLQTQVQNGSIDPADLPPSMVEGDPPQLRDYEDIEVQQPGQPGDDPSMDTVREQMEAQLSAQGIDANSYTSDLWDVYDSLDRMYSMDQDEIKAFIERGELPN